MIKTALEILRDNGASALIDFLTQHEDAQAVADACQELAMKLYNEEKDVPNCILVSRLGMRRALESAAALGSDKDHEEAVYKLRSTAKAIAYNLGANMWPGWDDPGITLDAQAMAVGLEAAETNLRLGNELRKEPLPISRAEWLVGAHEMARGNMDAARNRFGRASALAESVDAEADSLLNLAYAIMTEILEHPDDQVIADRLETVKADLAQLEQGDFFVQQLDTALRVFQTSD